MRQLANIFPLPNTFTKKQFPKAVDAFIPTSVVVPLKQESDYVCLPCVTEGQTVNEGDIIAIPNSDGDLRANIHSPLPGKVEKLILTELPNGKQERGIRIKFSGHFSYLAKPRLKSNWTEKFPNAIVNELAHKGVVNTFSTYNCHSLAYEIDAAYSNRYYSTEKYERLLVVRLFDNSPSIITDTLLYKNFPNEIINGAAITAYAMNASGIVFVYDKMTQTMPENFYYTTKGTPVFFVATNAKMYLNGFRNEISALISSSVKEKSLEGNYDCDVYVDASTMFSVNSAIAENEPTVRKYITVDGDCVPSYGFINVTLGMPISYVIEQCGGLVKQPSGILINGVMTGTATPSLDTPITKDVKSVTLVASRTICDELESECINCGNCRKVCPYKLAPDILYKTAINEIVSEKYIINSASLCTLCNLCNSVCPSRLPISQMISPLIRSEQKKRGKQ